MRLARLPHALATGFALAIVGCAPPKTVSRIEATAVTDLSGKWNDTDSRLVANKLIEQSLTSPWAKRYSDSHGGRLPAVLIGDFANRTMEHIPMMTFTKDLENAIINSGAAQVVASRTEREELRAERQDQQQNARAGTRARLANETGANYVLQGTVQAIEDQEGREKIVYYQVDATLVDTESNVKVWVGQHKIKKLMTRSRVGL